MDLSSYPDTLYRLLIQNLVDEETLWVLISHLNATDVEGLFTSKEEAEMYLRIRAVNDTLRMYVEGDFTDDLKKNTVRSEADLLKATLNYYKEFEILPVHHLRTDQPIYVIQSGNYHVFGSPEEYLTNSYVKWEEGVNSKDPRYRMSPEDLEDWRRQCTLKLNPKTRFVILTKDGDIKEEDDD